MNLEAEMEAAQAAAAVEGAVAVDLFHRRARTRIQAVGPGKDRLTGFRLEEGLAVRAWMKKGSRAGFAAAGGGGCGAWLGRQAAHAAGVGAVAASVAPAAKVAPPDSSVPPPDLLDPEWLRWTDQEMRRWLIKLLAPLPDEEVGRVILPGAARVELTLSLKETTLRCTDGRRLTQTSSLAGLKLWIPTAFGLSRLHWAVRRKADLEPGLIRRQIAYLPQPGQSVERVWLAPGGDETLWLAPRVTAWLLDKVARSAVASGPLAWNSRAVLRDDPLRPWGAGSFLFDGAGRAGQTTLLAGPQEVVCHAVRPSLAQRRISYRQPPQPAPSNLILEHLPVAAGPMTQGLHLLEPVVEDRSASLLRGVWRSGSGPARPVLVRLPWGLVDLLDENSQGVPGMAYVPGTGFVAAPTLRVSSVTVSSREV